MRFKPGDHVCSMYSTATELAEEAASFLAEGIRRGEQCWYVASGNETEAILTALGNRAVPAKKSRRALKLISADGAYVIRGGFDPETTIQTFNDAIEQAYAEGFTGFRAAAEMSWALDQENGAHLLIVYEALLRSLFANCRAIGLCLYDRNRMPFSVIHGALATHPVAGSNGRYGANQFYNSNIDGISALPDSDVRAKLEQLDQSTGSRRTES